MTQNNQKKCGKEGFDYCFWAKFCVAIPTLPLAAIVAALQFEDALMQGVASIGAVFLVVLLSRWIDRIPALQKPLKFKK